MKSVLLDEYEIEAIYHAVHATWERLINDEEHDTNTSVNEFYIVGNRVYVALLSKFGEMRNE